jgi:hypothetical protein
MTMKISRRLLLKLTPLLFWRGSPFRLFAAEAEPAKPFSAAFPKLDSLATGE